MAGPERILNDADFAPPPPERTFTDADFQPNVQQDRAGTETVFDDKRGDVFEVQPGLNARETEHVISTQYEKKPAKERFALLDLGISFGRNVPKGVAAGVLDIPDVAAQFLKDSIRSGFDPTDTSIADINPLSIGKMHSYLRSAAQILEATPLSPAQQSYVDATGRFQKNYREWIDKTGIKPDEGKPLSKFFFDLGHTGTSIAASIGALYVTRNPTAVGTLFGMLDAGETLKKGEAAGVPLKDRLAAGAVVGTFTAWTEGIGGEIFLRSMTMDKVLQKAMLRIASDSVQEGVQQGAQGAIEQAAGIQNQPLVDHLVDVGYAMLLGAIGSGPLNVSASVAEKHGFVKMIEEQGFSKEAAVRLTQRLSEKVLADPEVQEQVNDIFASEFSPVSMTLEERTKEFANVEKAFEEELLKRTGEELTKEGEEPDQQIAIDKVIRESRLTPAEVDAFPEIADFQNQMDAINEQLEEVKDPQIVASLKKRKEALLAPFEAMMGQTQEEIKELKDMHKMLKQELTTEYAPQGRATLQKQIREVEIQIKDKGKPMSKAALKEAVGMTEADAKMVSESKALKRSLKRQEQTARDTEIATRRRIETAQKLVRAVTKAVKAKNVAVEEKQEINALASLMKKAKTLGDLQQLAAKVAELKKAGRDKVIQSKDLKRARFEAQKAALLGQLGFAFDEKTGKWTVGNTAKLASTTERDLAKGVMLSTLTPARIFDTVDGGKNFNGVFHKIFYDLVNFSENYSVALGNEAIVRGVDILKKNSVKAEELNTEMEVDGLNFRYQEAMYIYAGFSQEQTRRAIVFGNRVNPLTVAKIIERLPQKFKNTADELAAELSVHFPRLAAAYLNFHDGAKELVQVKGTYLPMRRQMEGTENFEEELAAEIDDRAAFSRGIAEPGQVKARKDVKSPQQKPVNMNLWDLYTNHVTKRERFINMHGTLKELKSLLMDSELRNGLRQKHGAEMVQEFDNFIDRVAFGANKNMNDAVERVSRILRQRTAVLHLPFNILVMANQVSALPLFLGDVGPMDLISAASELTTNFAEKIQFIHDNDPQMRFRNIEKTVDEFLRAEPMKAKNLRDKVIKTGFQGIGIVDKYVASVGWLAKYNQGIREGLSQKEAVTAAQKAVLRTQNASAMKDVPSLYAKSEFLDTWLLFTNQLSKNYNMIVHDIPMRFRTDRKMNALMGSLGIALSYTVFWSLSHGRLPEDPEDIGEAMVDGFIGVIPMVGPLLNSLRKGFDGTPAAIGLLLGLGKAAAFDIPAALYEGDFEKAIDKSLYFAAGRFKLPYTGIRRSVMGLTDLATGEDDDLRRLVYTERMLDE